MVPLSPDSWLEISKHPEGPANCQLYQSFLRQVKSYPNSISRSLRGSHAALPPSQNCCHNKIRPIQIPKSTQAAVSAQLRVLPLTEQIPYLLERSTDQCC